MTGGGGSDTFKYLATSDSGTTTPTAHDVITDFGNGSDVIDFTAIAGITNNAVLAVAPATVAAHAGIALDRG